jgi:hypothetical protein
MLKWFSQDRYLCHGLLVLTSPYSVADLNYGEGTEKFIRVGDFSRDEAAAYLDAYFKARLTEEVATVAAVEKVKERVLALTTRPKNLGGFVREVYASKSEADFVARAEKWASECEADAAYDVRVASNMSVLNTFTYGFRTGKEFGTGPCSATSDLMRELLKAGGPVELQTPTFHVSAEDFASTMRTAREAHHAFIVDIKSGMVDFGSQADRKAAAELLGPRRVPA